MKTYLLLLLPAFLLTHVGKTQSLGPYFSHFDFTITNEKQNKELQLIEAEVWKSADSGRAMVYDNPMMDDEFRVKMTFAQYKSLFADSFPLHSFTDDYRIIISGNRGMDSIHVMSMNPFVRTHYREVTGWVEDSIVKPQADSTSQFILTQRYRHEVYGDWKEGKTLECIIPLFQYPAIIRAQESDSLKKTVESQLASILNASQQTDTFFRTTRFTCDSNECLAQAPYHDLLRMITNEMFSGGISVYSDCHLEKKLSKMQIENSFVAWDSAYKVEDPTNPGTYIYAPVRSEGKLQTLLICEKWIPYTEIIVNNPFRQRIPAYSSYRRVVTAYGLQLSNGKTFWFEPGQLEMQLKKDNFCFFPYEECFRAERFKTLNIQTH